MRMYGNTDLVLVELCPLNLLFFLCEYDKINGGNCFVSLRFVLVFFRGSREQSPFSRNS